jgi:hypothetical protein
MTGFAFIRHRQAVAETLVVSLAVISAERTRQFPCAMRLHQRRSFGPGRIYCCERAPAVQPSQTAASARPARSTKGVVKGSKKHALRLENACFVERVDPTNGA